MLCEELDKVEVLFLRHAVERLHAPKFGASEDAPSAGLPKSGDRSSSEHAIERA